MELFTEQIITEKTLSDLYLQPGTGETYINPTIIGGAMEGASYKSSISGARLEIFPESDKNIGIVVYNSSLTEVFKVLVNGTDSGDIVMGNYAGGQGAKYDSSLDTFSITGALTAGSIAIGTSPNWFKVDTSGNIWSGADTLANAITSKFAVTNAGALYATGATISGAITITGGSGIASLTDAGDLATQDTVDFATDVIGTEKPANNATVGATWGTNLSNIPATLGTPSGAGLYLSSTYLGYYSGSVWNAYIDSSGNFYFKGDANSSIDWNITTASTLTIKGKVVAGTGSSIGTGYLDGIVGLANTNIAAQGWTFTSIFSATNYRVIAWTTGVFTTAGGTAYSITAGNTGNMAATTYIYLDTAVSSTVLQVTTTATTANGSGKVLIAVASLNADTTSDATVQVFGGTGGQILLVDNIAANSASTNEFVSNSAQLANLVVTNAKINDLVVSKLTGGTITSQSIVLAVTEAAGDVEMRAGIAAGDFANAGALSGFIFGIDDSDLNKTKFYWGSPTAYSKFDGTNFTIRGVQKIERVWTVGEPITVSSVPIPVFVGDGGVDTFLTITDASGGGHSVGYSSAVEKQAQSIQETTTITVNQIKVPICKVASPTDTFKISIQTDSAGVPSGSILAYGTISYTELDAFPTVTEETITLDDTIVLTANTKYWIVAERTGSLNSTNYYYWDGKGTTCYANGAGITLVNSVWTTDSGGNTAADYYLKLDLVTATNKVYISDANNTTRDTFIGFVESTTAYAATTSITLIGIVGGFTGLTPNANYYVQDAIGTIGTTPGSVTIPVGLAISTTEILIDRT